MSREGRRRPTPMANGTRTLEYPRVDREDSRNAMLSLCFYYRGSLNTEIMHHANVPVKCRKINGMNFSLCILFYFIFSL